MLQALEGITCNQIEWSFSHPQGSPKVILGYRIGHCEHLKFSSCFVVVEGLSQHYPLCLLCHSVQCKSCRLWLMLSQCVPVPSSMFDMPVLTV